MNFIDPAEYDAIMKVIRIYIDDGGVAGDSGKVKKAFTKKP